MSVQVFEKRLSRLSNSYQKLINKKNKKLKNSNGIFDRYKNPVITAQHTPLFWKYDLDYKTNPHLMERLGINAAFNAGAIEIDDTFYLVVRVEGVDRKSFFAVAESPTGIDQFTFWNHPLVMPETDDPDINIYDLRVVKHEDGWIYGTFCTERKDDSTPEDLSSAIAQCGIARTKDLRYWERLDDLKTPSPQQRNCVLHPEFIDKKYAFYTRPADGFINTASGSGIGWGLVDDIEHAVINDTEFIIDRREYHTIKEVKNGLGPAPIKTDKGWLHLAHGVRACASGLRYVLYMFLTSLDAPESLVALPGGYFMAPIEEERIGDVSNVLFSNGWIAKENGDVFIYYASSDTRMHVATSTIEKLLDYVLNTPEDAYRTAASVTQRIELIDKNLDLINNE